MHHETIHAPLPSAAAYRLYRGLSMTCPETSADMYKSSIRSAMQDVVVDVMNYWPPVDGVIPEFEEPGRPSSEVVRDALPPVARLVKTLNHIGYHEIEELSRPVGAAHRVALAVAGDDPQAVQAVVRFVDDLGFDPVPAGPLRDSAALQPGSPVFGADLDAPELQRALAAATAAAR